MEFETENLKRMCSFDKLLKDHNHEHSNNIDLHLYLAFRTYRKVSPMRYRFKLVGKIQGCVSKPHLNY